MVAPEAHARRGGEGIRGGRARGFRLARAPRWLAWALLALASWGVWALLYRRMALSAAHTQALSTLGIVPVLIALSFSKRLMAAGNRGPGLVQALAAGAITCVGNAAYYHALKIGGKAATVASFTALYPLVTVVLAVLLLREKLNGLQVGGVVISLVAIYLFNAPAEKAWMSPWIGYALIPLVLWGISGFLQKLSTSHVSGELSTFFFLLAFLPAPLILLAEPLPQGVAAGTWLLAGAIGLTFALGNFAILSAFASGGKASVIAPLAALYPVVTVPLAIFLLGETVSRKEAGGIALALAGGAALCWEGRKAEPSPPAATSQENAGA